MKVWVNMNATFNLLNKSQAEAYTQLRSLCSKIIADGEYESVSFKSGKDMPVEDRSSYKPYNES